MDPLQILQLMHDVGLKPENLKRFPHQFSGGQRQCIGIARSFGLQIYYLRRTSIGFGCVRSGSSDKPASSHSKKIQPLLLFPMI
jgi:hypothetical protein